MRKEKKNGKKPFLIHPGFRGKVTIGLNKELFTINGAIDQLNKSSLGIY
jgi:hypothetical protein